jgi:hypothetical protein
MKLLKNNIKPKILAILLLCLVSLVLIPVILEMSGYRETMTDFVNFTDYNTIDRIKLGTKNSPKYSYCLGGTVECTYSDGQLIDISNSSYKLGKTYRSKCNDGSDVICSDNLFSSVSSYNLPFYTLPGGTPFPLSTTNHGFTRDYQYIPADFDSSDNFNIYVNSSTVTEKIHKCNLLSYENQANCFKKFFFDETSTSTNSSTRKSRHKSRDNSKDNSSSNSSNTTGNNSSTSNIADTGKCDSTAEKIPCLADYGTDIGENLCCGQTGVLQNTKYVCPITRPRCSKFKCGTQFGNCE